MSLSNLSLSSVCSSACRAAHSAAQAVVIAAGYFFYGYWFSHERA